MEPLTKEDFKKWADTLKSWKNVNFTPIGGPAMSASDFIKLIGLSDKKLAGLVANFALAANEMGNYVAERIGEATTLPRLTDKSI